MDPQSLHLQLSLRKDLKDPIGTLIKGTIDETIPKLKRALESYKGLLVGVGDVTAEILVNNDFSPDIIITDGYTKREKLTVWLDYPHYNVVHTKSPAAVITIIAWETLKSVINDVREQSSKIHIKVDGEEDLLVLPLILELPIDRSKIVYGQPNQGAVIIDVDQKAKNNALDLLERMEVLE